MKNTQIALLGGQVIPIYWGIKERNPDHVHLIYTEQLKEKLKLIQESFSFISFDLHKVDPYDFDNISSVIEKIVFENEKDEFELNLTGGTKIMTLAAHNVFKDLGLESFYLDQKKEFFFFKKKEYIPLKSDIKIETFLRLSGHSKINKTSLSSITESEFDIAFRMLDLIKKKGISRLFSRVASRIKDYSKPYNINLDNGVELTWRNELLKIKSPEFNEHLNHKKAFEICFSGLWWELVVAKTVRSWSAKKQLFLGVELLVNSDQEKAKNEIDIILSTGKSMIFLECKAGDVKQESVNKIRAVKKLYGGISTKSILVCYRQPRKDILEKCKDLDIEVFALQKSTKSKNQGDFIPLSSITTLNSKLTELVHKIEV